MLGRDLQHVHPTLAGIPPMQIPVSMCLHRMQYTNGGWVHASQGKVACRLYSASLPLFPRVKKDERETETERERSRRRAAVVAEDLRQQNQDVPLLYLLPFPATP